MKTLLSLLDDERWRPAWRVLLLALLVLVFALAVTPDPPQNRLPAGDKIDHLLAFASLAVAARFSGARGASRALASALGLLLYGGLIEIVQSRLPHRSAEWLDLLADGVGIAIGLLTVLLLRRLAGRAGRS